MRSSHHLAIIKLEDSNPTKHRRIFNYLRENKIGVQLHYSPVHLQPYFRDIGFNDGDFPESEAYAKSSFSLPLYPGLKMNEIKYVASPNLPMNISHGLPASAIGKRDNKAIIVTAFAGADLEAVPTAAPIPKAVVAKVVARFDWKNLYFRQSF